MEETILIAWLAFSAVLFILSLKSERLLSLAFIVAFGGSLIVLGVFVNNTGFDYLSAKNTTYVYAYNPFNATSNESRIANVTAAQVYGYTNVKNEYNFLIGWAFIILGAVVPLYNYFAYMQDIERVAKRREENLET